MKTSRIRFVSVNQTNVTEVLGPSERRWGYQIWPSPGDNTTFSHDPAVTSTNGLQLGTSGGYPIDLNEDDHGDIVKQPVFCISASKGTTVGVIEIFK